MELFNKKNKLINLVEREQKGDKLEIIINKIVNGILGTESIKIVNKVPEIMKEITMKPVQVDLKLKFEGKVTKKTVDIISQQFIRMMKV